MSFGLPSNVIEQVCAVFQAFPEVEVVKVFGSRAEGTHRLGSDVDLALFGDLSFETLAQIADVLEELPTPYRYDVTAYESLTHEDLKSHIDRVGLTLYKKSSSNE
jgi:predicted nucleotidyltransferase